MYRICFVFLIVLLLLPVGFAKGFRLLDDGDAQIRNRSGALAGRTVIRIRCMDQQSSEAGYPFLFILRHNSDAFRVVSSVTLRVDNGDEVTISGSVYNQQDNAEEVLQARGEKGLLSATLGIIGNVEFTEVYVAFSGDGETEGKIETVVNAMKTGNKLHVKVVTSDGKTRRSNFELGGTFPYVLDNVCLSAPQSPSDL